MWLAMASYLQTLSMDNMRFPGGRYACARELVRRGLPFLGGYSLGQLCHIVQLAISQKRILGYSGGALVPYSHSEEWIKEQHAFHQQPIVSKSVAGTFPLATWEEARTRLRELLNTESNQEACVVTLSNVKRLFRSRFQLELSETLLGHSRLLDLLQDVRFRDVCILQSNRNGQLLVKRVEGPQQLPCHQLAPPHAGPVLFATPSPIAACPDLWNTVYMGSVVYPCASLEANALPPKLSALRHVKVDLGMDSLWHGLPQTGSSGALSSRSGSDSSCKNRSDSDDSTDVPIARDHLESSSDEGMPPWPLSPLEAQANAIRAEEEEYASIRCLVQAEADSEDVSDQLQREHIVKNTFIEIPRAASAGMMRRLRSVPKNAGSRKSSCESADELS